MNDNVTLLAILIVLCFFFFFFFFFMLIGFGFRFGFENPNIKSQFGGFGSGHKKPNTNKNQSKTKLKTAKDDYEKVCLYTHFENKFGTSPALKQLFFEYAKEIGFHHSQEKGQEHMDVLMPKKEVECYLAKFQEILKKISDGRRV